MKRNDFESEITHVSSEISQYIKNGYPQVFHKFTLHLENGIKSAVCGPAYALNGELRDEQELSNQGVCTIL
jgi:hypothetical protein